MATFLDIFNDLLVENNLNRKQFAEQSGIPYTTVIGWTNLNRLPDYSAIIKIADFFIARSIISSADRMAMM